jgi:transposase
MGVDWRRLDQRIDGLSGEIEALARQDQACSRLMTVPGIGPIISSAMVAAICTGDVFSKGRDFGAWLGLVPKQISTGDRTILGKISRRGNRYLRVLFVQAAWVVLVRIKNWERYGLKSWIEAPRRRRHLSACSLKYDWSIAHHRWLPWRGGDGTSMLFRVPKLLINIAHLPIIERNSAAIELPSLNKPHVSLA